ncbi:hypothetical protein Q5P01_003145 [Channa striata]|uniref:Ig-like domain-containing protein n=1 Tax=Channa striata TaxID=64152 RepID=A0AA88T5E4_CHASR|nr:hypothetical protein Q5P01_003145 [Channa striata]
MNLGLLLLILLKVSQDALGVQVYEGEESVLLRFEVDVSVSVRSTVVWSREDLKQEKVHVRQASGDDYGDQNKLYTNRTSMRADALQTGDLSLNLTKPAVGDSGTYTCTVRRRGQLLNTTEVELLVKAPFPVWPWIVAGVMAPLLLLAVSVGLIISLANKAMKDRLRDQLRVVEVAEGTESVELTCTTKADLTGQIQVEWRRSVPKYMVIHIYKDNSNQPVQGYEGRIEMKNEPLTESSIGQKDLSLTLKKPRVDDGGVYICTVYKNGEIMRQKIVVLCVRETWIKTIRGSCCAKKAAAEQRAKAGRRKKEEGEATEAQTLTTEQSV